MRFSSPSIIKFFLTISIILILSSCSGKENEGVSKSVELKKIAKVDSILLLPIDVPSIDPDKDNRKERLIEGAAKLASILKNKAEVREDTVFMSINKMEALLDDFSGTDREMMAYLGRQSDTNAALQIQLSNYVKRVGGDYSVSQPASVAFSYRLVHTPTGKILCQGRHMETQEPLFSNLFSFFKAMSRGFKWVTAEELLREGVEEVFDECVYLTEE